MSFRDKSAENKYKNQWQKAKKDRIVILPDKADGLMIRQAAARVGKSITQYVIDRVKGPP